MNTLQRFEVWVSVLMMLICVVFLWESWDLPPGTFEPLGSGPVPKATAFVIIFCCIWVIISSLKNSPVTEESESDEGELSINAGLLIFFTTVLYTVFLQFRVMPFSWMTTLFLFFTIWGLERFSRKKNASRHADGTDHRFCNRIFVYRSLHCGFTHLVRMKNGY